MDVMEFVRSVLTLRVKYAFSVSSWGRTPQHNKIVGGVDDSYHQLWTGCDCVFDVDWDPVQRKYVTKKNLKFEQDAQRVGLQALMEADHYHLQPR